MIRIARAGIFCLVLVLSARAASAPDAEPEAAPAPTPDAAALNKLSARFAPVDLVVDIQALPAGERAALVELIAAAKIMDALFLRQVWAGNETLLLDLLRDRSPLGQARLHAFLQNKGPWLRLDGDRPFVPGVGPKPPAANFYPAGASKADVEAWMRTLPAPARTAAEGFFTTIRRTPDGALQAVPYSLEYQGELERAAARLRDAARLTQQPTLRAFLEARAAAFLSNDYYDSDVAWMKLDASIEPTIGPYEVYEDGWFSAKAAFEAYVSVRDDAETAKLAKLAGELQEIENNLPIDAKLRNPKLGAAAPIRVVNQLFCAGDANKAVQAAAFNLPNDERIIKQVGSKRTLIKNVQRAKFDRVLMPISRIALSPADRPAVVVRRVLHAHPDARADARPRSARGDRPRRQDDHRARGPAAELRRVRGGEGRHRRPVRAAVPDRQGGHRPRAGTVGVRDVPGVGVPHPPLRRRRPRGRNGAAAEHACWTRARSASRRTAPSPSIRRRSRARCAT